MSDGEGACSLEMALMLCSGSLMVTSSSPPDPGGVGTWFSPEPSCLGSELFDLSRARASSNSCCCRASCLVLGGCTAGGGVTPCSLSISSSNAIRLDREDMYAFEIGLPRVSHG